MDDRGLTPHQAQYIAWQLSRRAAADSVESLGATLVDATIDLNPHQVEAAMFACRNPLARGVLLADEVGLGKTIEAGLVISQHWAERKRRILIVVPANLRKQWHQELQDKFNLQGLILEAKNYNVLRKAGKAQPFLHDSGPVICSYQFAKAKADDLKRIAWDLVVMDEAHRLRNVYKPGNVIARTLRDALEHVDAKVLLTATPLQNSLLELYGLVSMIDERVFGDVDSFRSQFLGARSEHTNRALRERLAPLCSRTLRRQVQQYVPYTARIAIVQDFTPTADEQALSARVADYLRRAGLKALPDGQRQLISLVLWKLLASSSHAIAGALDTMANRLQAELDAMPNAPDLADALDEDYESLDETADEWAPEDDDGHRSGDSEVERAAIAAEIDELRSFKALASGIRQNSKGKALLLALDKALAELERLGAPKKAIIFTESRRTQDYLLDLLADTPWGDGIVLFNGSNSDTRSQAIYKDWLKQHEGSDRITGSKTADTRAALVEHFRERGTVMIATEAGAEGINLQFCSLVINYDLPWNPQRIEQRIGRCHRYGQKHDVVVVNFVDRSNEADRRVYELLAQKFQLFEGVFGASDEVLGAIGSGVDFERRIAAIYQTCRDPDAIRAGFEQLQLDLSGEIDEAMVRTRQLLLEHFDEEVQEKLRLREQDGKATLDKYERLLMALTRSELHGCATFDDEGGGFSLHRLPVALLPSPAFGRGAGGEGGPVPSIPLGRYDFPRRNGDAHLYRFGHPLAEAIIAHARDRKLHAPDEPPKQLVFDYDAYGPRLASLERWRGQRGWLSVILLTVQTLGEEEQHLLLSAGTADGQCLPDDDPDKLLRLPAALHSSPSISLPSPSGGRGVGGEGSLPAELTTDFETRKSHLLHIIQQRSLIWFERETQKLDAWADDLKLGLEQEIKEIDRHIKDVRSSAATAPTLEDKLARQKQQRELEARRSRLRRDLFARQDEVEAQRNGLIEELEGQLNQHVDEQHLFTIEWSLA